MNDNNRAIPFDAAELFQNLDGGVFLEKVARALADGALGVVAHRRQASVVLELTMKPLADADHMVEVSHKVKSVAPTRRGKIAEEDTTATPLYVNARGRLSLMSESQLQFPFMGERAEGQSHDG